MSGSYEVYVDVRHHPRHLDDYAERESNCGRYVWDGESDPKPLVAEVLRELADRLSPETKLEADERRVWVAVHDAIQVVNREWEGSPATRQALLTAMFALADSLGLGDEFLPGFRAQLAVA